MNKNVKIFSMENSKILGEKVSKILQIPLSEVQKTVFADGESLIQPIDTVRNNDIFIIASTSKPVNKNIMELLIFIDSLKRASVNSITVVMSYYGYSRQDRKAKGRQPITAKLIANMLETAGATKLIAVDLHNPSIQGFFDIPVDDLKGQYALAPFIVKEGKFSVVSPDHGGAVRARRLAELISNNIEVAIVDKRRTGPNQSEISGILGNVKGKNCIIIDDMIDTGGTIIKAAIELKKYGAKQIVIAATHGLFSKGFDEFESCTEIDKVIISDSIENTIKYNKSNKLVIASLDRLIANTIDATIKGTSISKIYNIIKKEL
ncbi:MAG: ribose-phosphate pyrophosphokinase [Mycoplasma sp.]|nr:ribose-phosphate pyrophosphokinase [Mycoplasma sp.]